MTDETNRIAGALSQKIFDDFCAGYGDLHLAGSRFTLAYEEDLKAAGLPVDDPCLLVLRRVRDGQLFEVELEATVRSLEKVSKDA